MFRGVGGNSVLGAGQKSSREVGGWGGEAEEERLPTDTVCFRL